MSKNTVSIFLTGTLVLLATFSTAIAQDGSQIQRRLQRQLQQAEELYYLRVSPELSVTERALLEYGGRASFAFLAIDDSDQETQVLRKTDVQLFGHLNIDGAHEFFGRIRYTYLDFNTGDSFDGAGDSYIYPLGDRWWYKFDLQRAMASYEGKNIHNNVTATIGRQWISFASGLVLSDQLYAANVVFDLRDLDLHIQGLVGATPSSSVIDFDSSRPSYDGDTDRLFYGGKITYTGIRHQRPYIFVLTQEDNNNEDFAVISSDGFDYDTYFDYNTTYWGVGSTGRFFSPKLQYQAEFVWETGDNLSVPHDDGLIPLKLLGKAQSRDDVEAWAAKAKLTYNIDYESSTKIEFETILASGDDDRLNDTSNTFGGNKYLTKDNAFNGFGYANTGLAFGAPISNLMMYRVGASTFPLQDQGIFDKLQIGINVFLFNKLDKDAPLDEPTNDKHYLGVETDVFANWKITSDVSVFARYGVFFPGSGIEKDEDERHFVYTGVSYSF